MANIVSEMLARVGLAPQGAGAITEPRLSRDSAQIIYGSPGWVLEKVRQGKGYIITLGEDTTPWAPAETAWDVDQPELSIDVATGKVIVPLWHFFYLEASAGNVNEIVILRASNAGGTGTSTNVTAAAAVASVQNLRADMAATVPSSVISYAYSGNTAAATNMMELWRGGSSLADAVGKATPQGEYNWLENGPYLATAGSSLFLHAVGGTAVTGYFFLKFLELDEDEMP